MDSTHLQHAAIPGLSALYPPCPRLLSYRSLRPRVRCHAAATSITNTEQQDGVRRRVWNGIAGWEVLGGVSGASGSGPGAALDNETGGRGQISSMAYMGVRGCGSALPPASAWAGGQANRTTSEPGTLVGQGSQEGLALLRLLQERVVGVAAAGARQGGGEGERRGEGAGAAGPAADGWARRASGPTGAAASCSPARTSARPRPRP